MSDCLSCSYLSPLVTIIIPVYEVEEYIERCLKSVVNQSYSNLEIIVINDATKDRSMDLVGRIKDDRIKIIEHEKNEGLAKSRNDGILASSGEYLAFLDSDDYFDLNFVEELLRIAMETKADVVMSSTRIVEAGKVEVFLNGCKTIRSYCEKIQSLPNGGCWNKLYKSELIKENDITFPVGKYWEDNIFAVKVAYFSNFFAFTNRTSYNYVKRPKSITTDSEKVSFLKRDSLFSVREILYFNNGKIFGVQERVALQVFIFFNFVSRKWLEDPLYREELCRLFVDNGFSIKKGGGGSFNFICFGIKLLLLRALSNVPLPFAKNRFLVKYRKYRSYSKALELFLR